MFFYFFKNSSPDTSDQNSKLVNYRTKGQRWSQCPQSTVLELEEIKIYLYSYYHQFAYIQPLDISKRRAGGMDWVFTFPICSPVGLASKKFIGLSNSTNNSQLLQTKSPCNRRLLRKFDKSLEYVQVPHSDPIHMEHTNHSSQTLAFTLVMLSLTPEIKIIAACDFLVTCRVYILHRNSHVFLAHWTSLVFISKLIKLIVFSASHDHLWIHVKTFQF